MCIRIGVNLCVFAAVKESDSWPQIKSQRKLYTLTLCQNFGFLSETINSISEGKEDKKKTFNSIIIRKSIENNNN